MIRLITLITCLFSMLIIIYSSNVFAEDLRSVWAGEWGNWTKLQRGNYEGGSISISHCNAHNECDFKIATRHTGGSCSNYMYQFKLQLTSSTSALSVGGCMMELTRFNHSIHLKEKDCRFYCYSGEYFPEAYPLSSRANYPDHEYYIPDFKIACFDHPSAARKIWCENPYFGETDKKIRDISEHLENLTEYKFTFNDNQWRDGIIQSCLNATDITSCLKNAYENKLSEVKSLETKSTQDYLSAKKQLSTPGDKEEASQVIDHIQGVYKYTFNNMLMDGEKYQSEDILEIVRISPNAIYFKTRLNFMNAHICDLFGSAIYTKDKLFLFTDNNENSEETACILKIIPHPNHIVFEANSACQHYCGARGTLNGAEFNTKSRRPIRYMKLLIHSDDYKNTLLEFKKGNL